MICPPDRALLELLVAPVELVELGVAAVALDGLVCGGGVFWLLHPATTAMSATNATQNPILTDRGSEHIGRSSFRSPTAWRRTGEVEVDCSKHDSHL